MQRMNDMQERRRPEGKQELIYVRVAEHWLDTVVLLMYRQLVTVNKIQGKF